jgi:hypothetical protein
MARAAQDLSPPKSSQRLVALRTLELQHERAATRTLAAEARQIKMATEKMKAVEAEAWIAEARLAAKRAGIRKVVQYNGCLLPVTQTGERRPLVKDFTSIKAKRDAMRKVEEQSVEGAFLAKLFRDDADQFLFETREWIRGCKHKLLELSGGTPNLDEMFPVPVLELIIHGTPIVDETLKEVGRQTIIEWCCGAYLYGAYSPDGSHYSRPLLITQGVYDSILEEFKTLFEQFDQLPRDSHE